MTQIVDQESAKIAAHAEDTVPLTEGGDLEMRESRPSDPSYTWRAQRATINRTEHFDGRYSSREPIARGGMGEVFAVWDERIGREVAVKLIRGEFADMHEHRARFFAEACLQARLEHPSIVPVHEVGVAPSGQLFFTMKRVHGLTLKDIIIGLREGEPSMCARFTRRRLLTAFSQVCITVAFAHDRGVVHRDLKPANIMLGDFGEAYVLDWGLAKHVDQPPVCETRAGFVYGTAGFMAPELLRGAPDAVSPPVDVFALGAILFEILTLTPLVPGANRVSMVEATLAGVDARFSTRCPEASLPSGLEAIVAKATAYKVENRYRSVRALHEAIERFLDGDRDLTLLAEMAAASADSAESALEPGGRLEESRVEVALQAVGRALVLDAGNVSAGSTLRKILSRHPLQTLPKEAMEAVAAAERASEKRTEISGAFMYLLMLSVYPLLLWSGVRDPTKLVVSALSLCGLALLSYVASRAQRTRPVLVYVRLVLGVGASMFAIRSIGPVDFLLPTMLAYVACFALKASVGVRRAAIGAGMLAISGNALLDALGVIAPSHVFVDGMRCALPVHQNLDPDRALLMMTLFSIGLILAVGLFAGRLRDELSEAERRMHTQNWLLSRLMPRGLRSQVASSPLP